MEASLALTESRSGRVGLHEDREESLASRSVLVVDDEPSVQRFVVRVLSRRGFQCFEASNASEAIALAINEKPDLTITDIRMPGSDGKWLLAQLKDRCPEMAVIMLTAVAEATTAIDCVKAGADDFLVKPINMDELVLSAERAILKVSTLKKRAQYQKKLEQAAGVHAAELTTEAQGSPEADTADPRRSSREVAFYQRMACRRYPDDLAASGEAVTESLHDLIDHDVAAVLLDGSSLSLVLRSRGEADDVFLEDVRRHVLHTFRLAGGKTREPVELRRVAPRSSEREKERAAGSRLLSFLNIPLTVGARTVGLLHVGSRRPDAYGGDDVATAYRLAGFLEAVVESVGSGEDGGEGTPVSKALTRALEPLPAGRIVEDIVDGLREEAREQGLMLRAEVEADLPLVYGDPEGLGAVVRGLVANAMGRTEAGGRVVVKVALGAESSGSTCGPTVRIDVSDTGIAIVEPHNGDGIEVAREIVDTFFGSLEVESQAGEGNRFGIVLPVLTEREVVLRMLTETLPAGGVSKTLAVAAVDKARLLVSLEAEGHAQLSRRLGRRLRELGENDLDALFVLRESGELVCLFEVAGEASGGACAARLSEAVQELGLATKTQIRIGTASFPEDATTAEALFDLARG